MTTKRKPYVREMKSDWWQKLGFYRFYIMRESTSVLQVWFSILVLFGIFALKDGPQSWDSFVGFLHNPIVLIINIVALAATLLHTSTWFKLAPKAVCIVVKDKKMSEEPIVKGFWALTILVNIIILAIALL
ncbi:fumarate reductase subunit FrdC [Moellerella wisconsensis]|uniref:Fumarate reductase subunit C n=1 Tax=Moellerella wisconsensis ATCC 35017 TaxID=1354267 RepID=A0A0N1KIV3_9GAMM|nr:fumarate reductase subunit FrdC [Moellerella wisconsensis]KPD04125.1 fumarate reductase subunit C [Moellerella wisconsensis ATCC 35017]VFS52435.1 Fumarate reductase 15 kDa hydrophobic protein [Moellerella wisconsensis]